MTSLCRAFLPAGIPAMTKPAKPVDLTYLDGKRPHPSALVRRQTLDMGFNGCQHSTLADSNVDLAAREAGAPVEHAAMRKINKYSVLSQSCLFQPIAVENAGVSFTVIEVLTKPDQGLLNLFSIII